MDTKRSITLKNAIGEKLLFIEVRYDAKSVIVSIKLTKRTNQNSFAIVLTRHHGKGLERASSVMALS